VSGIQWFERACATVALSAAAAVLSPAQTYTVLADFNRINGDSPIYVSLAQGTDGNLYGTTENGGSGYGNVFTERYLIE
jgi:hypothetical protein